MTETSATSESTSAPLQGPLRDCTLQGKGRGRLRSGDIAFVDAPDISRREAEMLINAAPAAVVNIARFSTGAVPNYGPHLLLDAGIPLFEAAGAEMRASIRDGKKTSVTASGEIKVGSKEVGSASAVVRALSLRHI